VDGVHEARIDNNIVSLKMQNVKNIIEEKDCYILDTGSPHYVKFVNDISNINVREEGKAVRQKFSQGINVNFIEIRENILVRTYERGVEDETLSCGTGVVASALAIHFSKKVIIIVSILKQVEEILILLLKLMLKIIQIFG
jgi:diaminopimelate epimerase